MKRGGIAVLMVMLTLLCACTAREAGSAAALMPAQVHEQTPEDTAPDTNAQESSETEAPEAATLPEEDAEPSEQLIFDSVDELWTLLDARSMPDDELEAFLREHGYDVNGMDSRETLNRFANRMARTVLPRLGAQEPEQLLFPMHAGEYTALFSAESGARCTVRVGYLPEDTMEDRPLTAFADDAEGVCAFAGVVNGMPVFVRFFGGAKDAEAAVDSLVFAALYPDLPVRRALRAEFDVAPVAENQIPALRTFLSAALLWDPTAAHEQPISSGDFETDSFFYEVKNAFLLVIDEAKKDAALYEALCARPAWTLARTEQGNYRLTAAGEADTLTADIYLWSQIVDVQGMVTPSLGELYTRAGAGENAAAIVEQTREKFARYLMKDAEYGWCLTGFHDTEQWRWSTENGRTRLDVEWTGGADGRRERIAWAEDDAGEIVPLNVERFLD